MKEVQQMHVGVGISFHRPGFVLGRLPVILGFCGKTDGCRQAGESQHKQEFIVRRKFHFETIVL